MQYYGDKSLLHTVKGEGEIEDIFKEVSKVLESVGGPKA